MDIDSFLVESAVKVSTGAINIFGDIVEGASNPPSSCLFRDIQTLSPSQQHRYSVNVAGVLWFGAGEVVALGDVYLYNQQEYFKIENIVRAKTLVTDDQLMFIKCAVSRTRQVS